VKTTLQPSYVVSENGKKKAVILDIDFYREIMEDLDDLRTIAERKTEKSIPLDQFLKRLKRARPIHRRG
jgi:PHD/YefM family antitoxin component YafN of YafNO toxin-antitoxin module